ncbi:MAG: hypothetical protein HZC25_14505 [Rhodospirillales bacterium]|nr:hypothetical protein [Rhodospirillales bacterium]
MRGTFKLLVVGLAFVVGGAGLARADYQRDVWAPLHAAPAATKATDAECLACHKEVFDDRPLVRSPKGVPAEKTKAWYQQFDTYQGAQDSFHRRHLTSDFARQVMDLTCAFCHQGHDPREESAVPPLPAGTPKPFTLRKQVNAETTCLMCHGAFPNESMGLPESWAAMRADLEPEGVANGCLTCHEEQFRTQRHRVTYLRPEAIEERAKKSSDVCYGCHGGRAWYRISYPYPRTPWPGMDPEVPDWAKNRPNQSDPRYRRP